MRRLLIFAPLFATLLVALFSLNQRVSFAQGASQQQQSVATNASAQVDPNEIIRRFSVRETEFRRKLNGYTFKRDATIQSIGMGGQVTGEYRRISFISFDQNGTITEKIIKMPISSLPIEAEDLADIDSIQTYAVEISKIENYKFTYVGKEKVDELNTYVFDVEPKVKPKPKRERYFQGRIWIDDQDLQIVKARGKGVPEGKQKFPTFETYREQFDGHYWFPSYTYADDELIFSGGDVGRIRMRIRFTDYERTQSQTQNTDASTTKPTTPTQASPAKPKP